MIDLDFIRYAISEKQDQAQISLDPAKLNFEIRLLKRRLHENDNNMQPVRGQQAPE